MAQSTTRDTVKRKELVARLGPQALQAFAAAAQSAKARGNPYVELVHFLDQLLRLPRGDAALICEAAGIDRARLDADIARAMDVLPHGAGAVEEFSDHIFRAIQEGWTFGSLTRQDGQVRGAYVLLAAMKMPVLEALLLRISVELDRIDSDTLAPVLDEILAGSAEGAPAAPVPGPEAKKAPASAGQRPALSQFASDLTERARAGALDPVIGRDAEIRQIVDILLRRRQNNPILTGEAGVGKTAVAEGFAQRLASGDVPPPLRGVELHALDIGLLQAGANVKGEFERRLIQVADEVKRSERPVILFIDEAHRLIGAGGTAGTGDAANLLKPMLARGELRTIAATTWAEYKEHIEKDPALTRRFQVVKVEEPAEEVAIRMCRGVAGVLEAHHRVEILDEAIEAAVRLSHRYIPARQLPDKAVSLLDTVCARVAVSQHATPAEVEDVLRRLEGLRIEARIVEREAAIGIDVATRRPAVAAALAEGEAALTAAQARWDAEKVLVSEILELRGKLRGEGEALDAAQPKVGLAASAPAGAAGPEAGSGAAIPLPRAAAAAAAEAGDAPLPAAGDGAAGAAPPAQDRAAMQARLAMLMADLAARQGEHPLILPAVDRLAVGGMVQDWTGIPLGRMLASDYERALSLASILSARVVGQDYAMEGIASRVQAARAGLAAPGKPVGVFLFCGPSGVGKTETALALAEALYGGEQNLITLNMSEFQEAHTVSTLKGAPPGYVGYGKGGILTEAVRRRPHAVVLLDEVEKAHPDVHEIFFQVFDKGAMDDSEGRRIDFRNTLILLTSNVGSEVIMDLTGEGRREVPARELGAALRPALLEVFPAALLGRMTVVPFRPLSDAMIETIARQKLSAIARRLQDGHGAELVLGAGVIETIRARCTEVESGGRMIDAILTDTLLPHLSREVLNRQMSAAPMRRVTVTGGPEGFAYAID